MSMNLAKQLELKLNRSLKIELLKMAENYGIEVEPSDLKRDIASKLVVYYSKKENISKLYDNLSDKEIEILKYFVNFFNNPNTALYLQLLYKNDDIFHFSEKKYRGDSNINILDNFELFFDDKFKLHPLFVNVFKSKFDTDIKFEISYLEKIVDLKISGYQKDGTEESVEVKIQKNRDFKELLEIFYLMVKNQDMKLTKQRVITQRSIKSLQKQIDCSDDDFNLLIHLLFKFDLIAILQYQIVESTKFDKLMNDKDVVKKLFFEYLNKRLKIEMNDLVIRYLKYLDFSKCRKTIFDTLKTISSKWISVDELIKEIVHKDLISRNFMEEIEFNLDYYGESKYNSTLEKSSIITIPLFYESFVKVVLKYMHFFNIIQIAQTEKPLYPKKFVEYVNYSNNFGDYDNITHIKITDFGEYILGKRDSFGENNERYKLTLEDNLEIIVKNPNKMSDIFLKSFSTKITDTRYKISIESIQNVVKNIKDFYNLKEKIKNEVKVLPKSWLDFFKEVKRRILIISVEYRETVLLKLKDDKEMLKLIANNPKLKNLILKADKFHIVVYRDELSKVKAILAKDGFLF